MMNLLRGGHTPFESPSLGKSPREPVVQEIIPSPEANEKSDPMLNASSTPKSDNFTKRLSRPMSGSATRSLSGRYVTNHVKDQYHIILNKSQHQLGASVGSHVFDTSFTRLLEYIRSERLTRLPHKGGAWDKVLSAAQYYAEQIHLLNHRVQDFVRGSNAAANLIFGQCLLLLELGHENASALRNVFKLFYQFGNELALLLKRGELFNLDSSIQDGISNSFVQMLNIVSSIAVRFHWAVHGSQTSVTVDIYAEFGSLIDTFRSNMAHTAGQMWTICLERQGYDNEPSVQSLCMWLAPQDSVLAYLSSHHVDLVNEPADYTCVWLSNYIVEFFKSDKKVMMIEGRSGSGKSTLAHWLTERLQRPIARTNVSSISFSFNQTVPLQSTSLALVKTLLYQLLEQRIGVVGVYEAIKHVYLDLKDNHDVKSHEDKLWVALTHALQHLHDHSAETLAIVIDGVDENVGQKKAAPAICHRLHDLARKFPFVRVIQFNTELDMKVEASTTLSLAQSHTAEDLRLLLQQNLSRNAHYQEQNDVDREKMIDRLVLTAEGSLLWAGLASRLLRSQKSHNALLETSESLQGANNKVPDIIQKLLAIMNLNAESKSLISWLCAAERPLSLEEIKLLMQCSVEKRSFVEKTVDVQSVLRTVRPFIIVGEGLVAIRHLAIKHALVNIPNNSKVSLSLTDRQRDLCTRLLIYSKACVREEHQVSLKNLDSNMSVSYFRRHLLLEYAVRYWPNHMRKMHNYKEGDVTQFTAFNDIFPSTVTFALLEQICWTSNIFLTSSLDYYSIANRIRQSIFGYTHGCVLQTVVAYTMVCIRLSKTSEAIKNCHLSGKISKTLFGIRSDITSACAEWFLTISETHVTKTRTEIMTYREETYLLLIECHRHRYGESSTQVLELYKKLVEFYTYISEEEKVTEIHKIIYRLTVTIYGEGSEEASSYHGRRDVTLHKHKHVEDIETYEGSIFEKSTESSEEFTIAVVERMIVLAATYIKTGKISIAEEIYVELWLKLTEKCRMTEVLEWSEQKITVMIVYARFLESHHRHSEASTLLLSLWREYEFHAFSAVESIVIKLKEVGILMKKLTLLNAALSVFRKCWSFFKSTNRIKTTIFHELEEHIAITSKELIIETTKTTTSTTTTSTSESVIREVFESSFSSSTTEVSSTTIELCKSLSSIYIREERYSEAIKCIKSVVKKSWSSFFSASFESTLSKTTISETTIKLLVDLAISYSKQTRIEKAESIYVKLYAAVRSSYRLDHEIVIKQREMLLEFYRCHKYVHKIISFQQELLIEYRSFYGGSHSTTIKLLYALGESCRLHFRTHGYWLEYYLEIVHSLNADALVCHHDAIKALVIVAENYFEDRRYSESLTYYKVIASTFYKHGVSYAYFKETKEVQMIFEHYERSLVESKVELSVRIAILKEYRESCVRHYTESASITISATLQYASVCMTSETHQSEAISLYEHVLKHTSSTEIITRSKTTLRSLYMKQVTSTKTTTKITEKMLATATTLTYERYLQILHTHSCTSRTTINCLSELIQLYYRQSKVELATKELRSLIIKCISEVTIAKELMAAAIAIGTIYHDYGYFDHAHSLLRELKMQIIFKSKTSVSKWGFDLTTATQASFAFLAAFEMELLREQSVTITELIAEYSAMVLYHQRYTSALKSKSNFANIFFLASKLRHVISKRKRIDYYWTIEHEVFSYFSSVETRVIESTGSTASVKQFVTLLLEYCGDHRVGQDVFVATAGRAATTRILLLLEASKFKEALDLCKCTFYFLVQHGGLDEEKEISQGFTLSLMMAGRGYPRSKDGEQHKVMMNFSRQIMKQVFEIIHTQKIKLARLRLEDVNQLIGLLGEQQDYHNLQLMLKTLWDSREGQKWSQSTTTSIARCLIQAYFQSGQYRNALCLAEDMLYNVRRVHGSQSEVALAFYELLARLYISAAKQLEQQNNKIAKDTAKSYYRKAVELHNDVLKLFVAGSEASDDEDISDLDSEISSSSTPSSATLRSRSTHSGNGVQEKDKVEVLKRHTRFLKLGYQRLGGWSHNPTDFEKTTDLVWQAYGKELGMEKKNVSAKEWSATGFGDGKAEGKDDEFSQPSWVIM